MKKYYFHTQKFYAQSKSHVLRVLGKFCCHTEHTLSHFLDFRNVESFFINGCLGQETYLQEEVIPEKKFFYFCFGMPHYGGTTLRLFSSHSADCFYNSDELMSLTLV